MACPRLHELECPEAGHVLLRVHPLAVRPEPVHLVVALRYAALAGELLIELRGGKPVLGIHKLFQQRQRREPEPLRACRQILEPVAHRVHPQVFQFRLCFSHELRHRCHPFPGAVTKTGGEVIAKAFARGPILQQVRMPAAPEPPEELVHHCLGAAKGSGLPLSSL